MSYCSFCAQPKLSFFYFVLQMASAMGCFSSSAVLTMTLLTVYVNCQYMLNKSKTLKDTALEGAAFLNLTDTSVDMCFLACVQNCRCMTIQTFKSTECQLLSSNRFQDPLSLVSKRGYIYYDMRPSQQVCFTIHQKGDL